MCENFVFFVGLVGLESESAGLLKNPSGVMITVLKRSRQTSERGIMHVAILQLYLPQGWVSSGKKPISSGQVEETGRNDQLQGPAPGGPISQYPDFKYLISQLAATVAAKIHYVAKLISQYPNFSDSNGNIPFSLGISNIQISM